MKKNLFYMMAATIVALISVSFVSCGDDEEDDFSSEKPSALLKDANGNAIKLISAGNVEIIYDADGKLSILKSPNTSLIFDGPNLTCSTNDGGTIVYKFSLNGKGFLTKMEANAVLSDSHGTMTTTFNYNSNDQLTSIRSVSHGIYDNGVEEIAEQNQTNTWENGKLVKATFVDNGKVVNGIREETWEESYFYTIEYGTQANPAKQLSLFLGNIATGLENTGLFAMIGLLGVGPDYLPTGYSVEYLYAENGVPDGHGARKSNYTLSYELNDNGTIAKETKGRSQSVSYRYDK